MRNQATNPKQRLTWQEKWSDPRFDPWWQTDDIPDEFQAALRDYAPDPGSKLLDVGCGAGLMACLLSRTYPDTVGIDIAPAAIARARAHAVSLGAPARFEVADICKEEGPAGPFDVVIERGCLHVMNETEAKRGAGKIGRRVRSGGHFFQMRLLHQADTIADETLQGLGTDFHLEHATTTEVRTRKRVATLGYFVYAKKDNAGMGQ